MGEIGLKKYSVVIFAAGMGKRLGSLGKRNPKCLLKINDSTLIEIITKKLFSFGAEEITIILGYKAEKIIKHIKKQKIKKIKFIKIKNYNKNGHAFTWYEFNKYWKKNSKPVLFCHADICFDNNFLKNIIKSPKKNIIGVRKISKEKLRSDSLVIKAGYKNDLIDIDYNYRIINPNGEIIGINKISKKTNQNIYKFMKKFFKSKNRHLNWEPFLKRYIELKKDKFFILNNQNYNWININRLSDYNKAINLKF